jgi:hypothetical protein
VNIAMAIVRLCAGNNVAGPVVGTSMPASLVHVCSKNSFP